MSDYPFDLVTPQADGPIADNSWLAKRPFMDKDHSLKEDACYFVAGEKLADAINTAIAVGKPLLITGEPGTGKTPGRLLHGLAARSGMHSFPGKIRKHGPGFVI